MSEERVIIGGAEARGILTVPKLVMSIGPGGHPVAKIVYVPVYVVAPVFGAAIILEEIEHSIMEGAIVTNLNFHCASQQPPVASSANLPGPTVVQA